MPSWAAGVLCTGTITGGWGCRSASGGRATGCRFSRRHGKAPVAGRTWLLAAARSCWSLPPRPWPTASASPPRAAQGRRSAAGTTAVDRGHPAHHRGHLPGVGHADGAVERRHQHHVLHRRSRSGRSRRPSDAGGGRNLGAAQPDHHPLRPGRTAHPVLERGGDRPRRAHGHQGQGRARPARRHRRSASPWPTATSSGSRSCWPSSTTCRCRFTPSGTRAGARDTAAAASSGTFAWRWPSLPADVDVAVDPGRDERHHQGGRDDVREPERTDRRRAGRARGVVDAAGRRRGRQGRHRALHLRARLQGPAGEPDPVQQRRAPVHQHPGQHRRPRRRHDGRHLSRSSST